MSTKNSKKPYFVTASLRSGEIASPSENSATSLSSPENLDAVLHPVRLNHVALEKLERLAIQQDLTLSAFVRRQLYKIVREAS